MFINIWLLWYVVVVLLFAIFNIRRSRKKLHNSSQLFKIVASQAEHLRIFSNNKNGGGDK